MYSYEFYCNAPQYIISLNGTCHGYLLLFPRPLHAVLSVSNGNEIKNKIKWNNV